MFSRPFKISILGNVVSLGTLFVQSNDYFWQAKINENTGQIAGANQCDLPCLSYCMYYYPSDSCVQSCLCQEYIHSLSYINAHDSYYQNNSDELLSEATLLQQTTDSILKLEEAVEQPQEEQKQPYTQPESVPASSGTPITSVNIPLQTSESAPKKSQISERPSSGTQTSPVPPPKKTSSDTPDSVTSKEPVPISETKPISSGGGSSQTSISDSIDAATLEQMERQRSIDESRATCMTTCNLKCKSESAEKKDACVSLCFNQCSASIAMEKQKPSVNMVGYGYLSLAQQDSEDVKLLTESESSHPDAQSLKDAMLRHTSFQLLDQPRCTTQCVAECGTLADLPRTTPEQLVGCFSQKCGCKDKQNVAESLEPQLTKKFFDIVHNQERVRYLMLQQGSQLPSINLEAQFLGSQQTKEQFLGTSNMAFQNYPRQQKPVQNKQTEEDSYQLLLITLKGASAVIICSVIFLVVQYCHDFAQRHKAESKVEMFGMGSSNAIEGSNVKFDCEKAIMKKMKLEEASI